MSYEYSFVVTKKTGETVDVYVYNILDKDMVNKLNLENDVELKHYSVTNNNVSDKKSVKFSDLKEGDDNSTEDKKKDDAKIINDTKSINDTTNSNIFKNVNDNNPNEKYNFGGKERKRKGRTHKKVKRGGMKTIKIWR
jgi:hypothetical protein